MSDIFSNHKALTPLWATPDGWKGKLASVNHTDIGLRFMITAAIFFGIGGILAMIIRAQLATPDSAFLGPEIYNQVFTMHGTIMMFLFAIPMLEGLSIYLIPKMLGARDLAFPRLTAYGYWCYLFGGTIIIAALLLGVAPDSGWFMYTPLSSNIYTPGINADIWLIGITFVEISAMTLAIELVVSILKMRAPGMSLARMPIFAWYILVTASMMVVGFPPLILGSILLEVERAAGLPFFDPERGGDPLLWQHLFWLFGHPEVYIIFLPAAGAIATMIPTCAQHPLVGYRAIIAAIIAMAFLSFGIWVHHMFTTGIPHLALSFFAISSALVAIPTAVQFFSWLATLAIGKPQWNIPMLYIFGFFAVFIIGGLTGVMIAMVPFNWQAHDTHFIVAHLHYVLVGGFVFPVLAALYYWLPHVTGRQNIEKLAVIGFWLIFIGFNATFILMHLTGLLGMPRRIFTYDAADGWGTLNLLSSIGGFIMTMGFGVILMDLFLQRRFGKAVKRNPWNASTLEWAMQYPPPTYNFATIPEIDKRADKINIATTIKNMVAGHGYLANVRNDWRETMGVNAVSGKPEYIILLPGPTRLPLYTALITGIVVLSLLFKVYLLALAAALFVISLMVFTGQSAGLRKDHGFLDAGMKTTLPLHTEVSNSPPWMGICITLFANGTLFTSLIFGIFYLWLIAPNWPPEETLSSPLWHSAVLAGLLSAMVLTGRRLQKSRSKNLHLSLMALLQCIAMTVFVMIIDNLPDPRVHAYAAANFILMAYVILHLFISLLFVASTYIRLRNGYISVTRNLDLRMTELWTNYTVIISFIAIAVVLILPIISGGNS